MSTLRKIMLNLFLIIGALSSINVVAQDSVMYSFFTAGHTYGTPVNAGNGLFDDFVNVFPYIKSRDEIKFGVLTGDIVFRPSVQAWDNVDQDINDLGLPIYIAVGNHDMKDRPLFEQRYGETYYYFLYNNDLFFILDPNLESWNISKNQLDMIKTALDENLRDIDNIFIFFHQVLWKSNDNIYHATRLNSTEGKADTINFWSSVEPLFYKLPKNVVMYSGDVGGGSWASNFMFDQYNNITLIASGMGNRVDDNFVITNIDKNKNISFDLISLGNDDLFSMGDIKNYDIYPTSPHNDSLEFKIYPNPITTNSFVVLDANNCILDIYDIRGINIFSSTIGSEYEIFDADFLPKGVYVFKVTANNHTKSVKIIKI